MSILITPSHVNPCIATSQENKSKPIPPQHTLIHSLMQSETITSINEDTTPEVHDSATVYDTHSKFKPPDNQPQWTKTTLIKHIKQQAFLRTNHVDSMSLMTTWSHVSMPDELHHRENDNEQEN
ncbi:hypothetical protein [Scardovia wiggsiae]